MFIVRKFSRQKTSMLISRKHPQMGTALPGTIGRGSSATRTLLVNAGCCTELYACSVLEYILGYEAVVIAKEHSHWELCVYRNYGAVVITKEHSHWELCVYRNYGAVVITKEHSHWELRVCRSDRQGKALPPENCWWMPPENCQWRSAVCTEPGSMDGT